ncbi:MAG TPA: hypothetical protein VFI65_20925 [Streptosporangiaceae bacterium]|nr:hypothetical protein [Streptosporangiaceae bacterium]
MKPRSRHLWAAVSAGALLVSGLGTATAAPRSSVSPARVYAPYFEAYLSGSLASISSQSGVRFVTLAFVQAATKKGSAACTLTWNGNKNQPVSKGGYRSGIRRLRSVHGDAIVSFGGFSADHGGTEIADSCHSVPAIAAAYEQLVRTYNLHRLDMDIEDNSVTNTAGIDRRNQAIAMLEAWAKKRGIPLWIQFTLGVEPTGFDQPTLNILRNAVKNHTRVDSINIMVFDYYLGKEKHPLNMRADAIKAANTVHRQLAHVYPSVGSAGLWRRLGFTLLPGIDDYPGKTEITSPADAKAIMKFALSKHMDFLSIWALQRDNGGCPGAIDSNTCSGIKQAPWTFSHLLEPFTG